jgi:phosphomannomutase
MCYVLQVSDYKVGAVMVTGSHIKANLNGVKFFVGDGQIVPTARAAPAAPARKPTSLYDKVSPSGIFFITSKTLSLKDFWKLFFIN